MNIKQLRESIAKLLRESVCPGCNHPGAYIGGMNNVECPNPDCRFFSEKQYANYEIERDAWDCEKCDQKDIPVTTHRCPDCGHDPHDETDEEHPHTRELEWYAVEKSFPTAADEWKDMGTGSAKHDDFWIDEDGDLCARPLGSRDEYIWDSSEKLWGKLRRGQKTTTILGPPVKF